MPIKEPGYVYILTNPSFKEDWVKIGKSGRPVNVRSKELDNTAVPLPFDIYATLKTVKYNEAEKLVHGFIDQLTTKRIRKTREFFNLTPDEALQIFKNVAYVLDDAEIAIYKENKIIEVIAAQNRQEYQDEQGQTTEHAGQIDVAPDKVGRSWLIPFNKKFFDLDGCIKKYGRVYWSQKCSFALGDTVYVYSSKPDAKITYCLKVHEVNVPDGSVTEGNEFRKTESKRSFKDTDLSALLVSIGKTQSKVLNIARLKEHGLKSAPFGPVMLSKDECKPLLEYIENNFDSSYRGENDNSGKPKGPRFKFSMCDIKPGESVVFSPLNLPLIVSSDNTVEYKGKSWKLSEFTKKFIPDSLRTKTDSYRGSLFFTYNGEVLQDIRERKEKGL